MTSTHPSLDRLWLLGFVLTVLAAAWIAHAWAPGDNVHPDSATYLQSARELARGHGFVTARVGLEQTEPAPVSRWPPAFSALIAVGMKLGATERQAAALWLTVSFVAYAAFTFLLVLVVSHRRWWPAAALVAVVVMLHPGTLEMLDSVLSDLPFATATVGVVCLAATLAKRGDPSTGATLLLGLLSGALILVRYAGLFVAASIALGFLLALWPKLGRTKTAKTALFLGLGVALVAAPWLARNVFLTGLVFGGRPIVVSNPANPVWDAVKGILSAFLGGGVVSAVGTASILLTSLAILLVTRGWRARELVVLLCLGVGYPGLMVITWTLHRFDPLSWSRFWLSIWPVGGALVVGLLSRLAARRVAQVACALLCLLGLLPSLVSFSVAFRRGLPTAQGEKGFARSFWSTSAPIRYLREEAPQCVLVSNEVRLHLLHNDVPVVYMLPTSMEKMAPLLASERDVCLVYFIHSLPPSMERRREGNTEVLRALEASGRIRLVAEDEVGQLWIAEGAPRDASRSPEPRD